jgi:hypothetical protein
MINYLGKGKTNKEARLRNIGKGNERQVMRKEE